MKRKHQPFFEEVFRVSEIDCKDNEFSNLNSTYCGIDIISDVPAENWDENTKGMMAKIIELCGHSIDQCRLIQMQNGDELSASIRRESTKYILAFIESSFLKKQHFQIVPYQWLKMNDTKVIVNDSLKKFSTDTTAKKKLWQAMQSEFEKAKKYNEG